jgi:hypothetical protein
MVTKRVPVMPTGLHWCKDAHLMSILRSKRDAQLPPGHVFRVRLGPIDVNCGRLCELPPQVQRVRSATCATGAPFLPLIRKAHSVPGLVPLPCLEFSCVLRKGKEHGIFALSRDRAAAA